MGQEEVYNLIRDKPRLSTRELSDLLGYQRSYTSKLVYKLVKQGAIKEFKPNRDDIKRIKEKNPNTIILSLQKLKVFSISNNYSNN